MHHKGSSYSAYEESNIQKAKQSQSRDHTPHCPPHSSQRHNQVPYATSTSKSFQIETSPTTTPQSTSPKPTHQAENALLGELQLICVKAKLPGLMSAASLVLASFSNCFSLFDSAVQNFTRVQRSLFPVTRHFSDDGSPSSQGLPRGSGKRKWRKWWYALICCQMQTKRKAGARMAIVAAGKMMRKRENPSIGRSGVILF